MVKIIQKKVQMTKCFPYIQLNPPNAFWGLLGPRKDVMVNFTKTVSMETATQPFFPLIFLVSMDWLHGDEDTGNEETSGLGEASQC